MSAGPSVINVPYIDIQHDALSVFDDVEQGVVLKEDIWISGYRNGSSSIHGKARIEFQEGGGSNLKARDGVKVKKMSKFEVSIPQLHLEGSVIKFPRQVIHPPYTKAKSTTLISQPPLYINSLAYSPQKQKLAVAGPDGYLCLLPTGSGSDIDKGIEAVMCKRHVGDVLDVKFFPSGEVLLSTSSDLSIRVWGLDGSNPRTLKGHTRAITCTCIISVGRQILSGSKDGTIRLWNVGESREVKKWNTSNPRASVEGLYLDGNCILGVRQDGVIQIWDLNGKDEEIGRIEKGDLVGGGAMISSDWDPKRRLLVMGYSNGIIHIRQLPEDLRNIDALKMGGGKEVYIKRNETSIYSVKFSEDGDLLVGTASGLPCRLGVITPELNGGDSESGTGGKGDIKVVVKEEYAGWEAVGVEAWAEGKEGTWVAGGEGGIRRY